MNFNIKVLICILCIITLSYSRSYDCPPTSKCLGGNYCLSDLTCRFDCFGGMGGPNCNTACGANCKDGSCVNEAPATGKKPSCTYACNAGYYTPDCEKPCPSSACEGNRCNFNDGKCTRCLGDKKYDVGAEECKTACPATCLNGKCSK
jgi:hypothetical protein